MKLPSLDDLEIEKDVNSKEFDDLLNEFEGESNNEEIDENDNRQQDSETVSHEDSYVDDFESFEQEEYDGDPNVDLDDEFERELENQLRESDSKEYVEDIEDDYEGDFGSLLPGMEPEENLDDNANSVKEDENAKDDSGADEKIKELFMGVKDKALSLFKGFGKGRIPKGPKSSNSKSGFLSLFNNNKVIIIPVASILLLLLILYFSSSLSYKTIDNINQTVEFNDKDRDELIVVNLSDMKLDNDNVNVTMNNEGEMSANYTMELNFKKKSIIPFVGAKVECESDIVYLEPEGDSKEAFSCNGDIDEKTKYKIKANLENF